MVRNNCFRLESTQMTQILQICADKKYAKIIRIFANYEKCLYLCKNFHGKQ